MKNVGRIYIGDLEILRQLAPKASWHFEGFLTRTQALDTIVSARSAWFFGDIPPAMAELLRPAGKRVTQTLRLPAWALIRITDNDWLLLKSESSDQGGEAE
jgi:hypothetical protein